MLSLRVRAISCMRRDPTFLFGGTYFSLDQRTIRPWWRPWCLACSWSAEVRQTAPVSGSISAHLRGSTLVSLAGGRVYHGLMNDAEKAWREVRKAKSFPQVISRSIIWLEEVWPQARILGHTRRSTRDHAVPDLHVDDENRGRHTAGYWVDDQIIIPTAATLRIQLQRYTLGASPTLDFYMIGQTLPDYTRSIIVHEVQHAFDYVDVDRWVSSMSHDKRYFTRLTKLEATYSPVQL